MNGTVSVDKDVDRSQINNWQKVLTNYREITTRDNDEAESVADQLSKELLEHPRAVPGVSTKEAEKTRQDEKFTDFGPQPGQT